MSDVFVSYKAEDRARVRSLVEALEADGLSVWWDAHIGGGDEWRDTIARHLDEARCVIVVWSRRSVGPDGRFVRDEAARALRRGVYLPVRIDKVEPPLGFGETQALPLSGWKGNRSDPRYAAVAKAVRAITGLGSHAHVQPDHSTGIGRRPLVLGGAAAIAAAAAGGWLLLKPGSAKANSIAVLPFANLSGDPAQAYFSDGMAEELRSALSRIAGLKVVARTSSEKLRDSDAKTAASKLGVGHIVSGSVRRSPTMIRVSAQLIDGGNGLERWSETFDRPAGDVLKIQTEIAENVAQALSIRLAGADRAALALGGTRNPAAQDLLLQSDAERLSTNEAELRKALALLDAAIALDPNFAKAHAFRASVLNVLAGSYALSAADSRRGHAVALESANRAIAIAPQLALGYAARGHIFNHQLNMGAALAELAKAEARPGGDAATLRTYAIVLSQCGRSGEAMRMAAKLVSLDPLNSWSFEIQSRVHYQSRRHAEAATFARRALELSPDRQRARSNLALALLAQNKRSEAEGEFRKLDSTDFRRLVGLAVLAAQAGDRATAMTHLNAIKQQSGDFAHYQYGQIYSQLGSTDLALAELEAAWAAQDTGLAGMRVDPLLDPLRGNPRLAAIESRLHFPRS
jgi:TolB-like protein/Tfp pilus assembly protein PilF